MLYLFEKVQESLRLEELTCEMKTVLSKLINIYKKKLQKSHRNIERCINANRDWFNTYVSFPISDSNKRKNPGGRPSKDFEDCAERTKRKKTEEVRKQFTPFELAFAAQMGYRASGDLDRSKLIKDVSIGTLKTTGSHASFSPDKALSLVIEGQLTKYQYNLLRKSALEMECNLYPNYESVTEAKKKCYPLGISCSEIKAEVPLQSLLDKTSERLLLSLNDVLFNLSESQRNNLILISKWGCDGSGTHSQYKQKFETADASDEYMMITSIVPIRLMSSNNLLIWQNPRPSSPRYCRPLRLQMAHETVQVSQLEVENIKLQLANLLPTINQNWSVYHNLKLTMVDGKMINSLTNTSSPMRCYICNETSKTFNNLKVCINTDINQNNLEYGMSSLHAWIRFAECILHISYKLKLAKWQARGAKEKEIVASEKKKIQKEFLVLLGLHIDKPRPGGGTSTDGNTARRIFQHAEQVAAITKVNLNIINRFHVILKLISCGFNIHTAKFKSFCLKTASTFVMNYPWFNMPTTVHKILIHGHLIMENFGLAIGLLSEDAQESRNKDVRKYREQFSRKFSRKLAMEDTYHRLIISSDPYISGLRTLHPRKTLSFSSVELSMINENI